MSNKMPPKRPLSKSVRPPVGRGQHGQKNRHNKHYWHHYYDWPYWDYDWYDWEYDWYDWDDNWHDWEYAPNRKPRAQRPMQDLGDVIDPVQQAYQQGFKDGWVAAMDYLMYGEEMVVEPITPVPPMPPSPPMPKPQGPDPESNS